MATLYSDRVVNATTRLTGTVARSGIGLMEETATYTLTAALALNDVIQMVRIPQNATIISMTLSADDLDSNGSPAIVLDVGDGSDTDRFIDGSTIGQAGGVEPAINNKAGHLHQYTSEDTIDVLVQVAPATGATSGTIKLSVIYTLANL